MTFLGKCGIIIYIDGGIYMCEEMEKWLKGEELTYSERHDLVNYAFMNEIEEIEDVPRRWNQWVEIVFKYNGEHYMIGYDRGLTECQEDFYEDSVPVKVKPVKKMVEVVEWEVVE